MFDNLVIGQECSVLVKTRDNDVEVKETIKFLGTREVGGQYGCAGNETLGYLFETKRGIIILTNFATYSNLSGEYYITIYNGYADNRAYKFIN